ncbi:hypothetical protein DASB73_019360 [Starmerella bacillaris]|uniref:Bromo domain-containing protein n=1 Tax=Starmerella bacillaris TaxID=1247836 RepID=A0AAV5RIK0_STABA|nr:hypothetical protein DASB73_019360 [Starmerella bacillaris]
MAARRRGSGNAGANNDNKYASLLKDIYQIRVDGRSVVELFEEVPDAQMYPDYRDVVYVPISLAEIGKRIRVGAYEDDDSIISDFELMAENARLYNGNESPVYDDAVDILDFVLLYFKRPLSKITRLRLQTQIVNELTSYKYKGRKFSDAFMAEPDAKTYPNYRTIIKEPTSFAKVYKQLEKEPFPSWTEFRESVDLIFANALKYNQEGSQIANDANSLRKQLDNKIKKYSTLPKHLQAASGAKSNKSSANNSARNSVKPESDSEDENDDENSDEDSGDDEPPFVAPKYEDDDDDDFEADSDDMDDEDRKDEMSEDQNQNQDPLGDQMNAMNPRFMQPAVVYDEIVYRLPNEGIENALIKLVTCHSTPVPSQLAMNLPIEDVKRAENDMLQIRILPSPTKAFTSYATTLPYYQSTLRLAVHTNKNIDLLQLSVLFNGAKLMPIQQLASPDAGIEHFEITLSPGLNQLTVIAIKPTYGGGYVRQYGPPPLADAEDDEERVVLFLNLSK